MQAHLKKTVAMLSIAGALVGGTSAYAASTGSSATTTTPSTATATTDIPSTGTTTTPSTDTPSTTTAPPSGSAHADGDCPGM